MINSLILVRILDGHHITCVFYDTYNGTIALSGGANFATFVIRYIEAVFTVADFTLQLNQRFTESVDIRSRLIQKMKNQTKSGFLPNTW